MAEVTYLEALRQGLREEMRRDPSVFILGEDVGKYGGAFKVTEGFSAEFGEQRVIDTPISEAAIVGAAAGAAHLGMRPVAEMQFIDFISCAYDMLTNYVATARYRAGLPEPLRSTLGAPARWTTYRSLPADSPKVTDVGAMFVEPATVPQLMDHARYVAGRPPRPTDISAVPTSPPAPGDESLAPPTPTLVVEIAMSSEMARTMEWSLGESRTTGDRSYAGTSVRVQLTLVGIFEPDDPTSSFWQNAGPLLHANWTENGDVGTIATGRGVVAGAANLWWMDTSESRLWFPLLTDRLDAATAPRLADQLRTDLAAFPLGADRVGTAPLSTEAPDHITAILARAKAAGSVLTLAVAAPAGVLLALLALAAQVVVGPRRGAHLLTALRGGSLHQHRMLLGTEAALV